MRHPMIEHECAGCDGMLEAFIAGIFHAYDQDTLERDFLLQIESRLKVLLVDTFGFCPTHADEAVRRLHEYAANAKKVNAVGTRGETS